MIQALFVWHESSQLLVQRRYSEMQQSVLARLDQIYNEFYKPEIHNLSRRLVTQVPLQNDLLDTNKFEEWLNLSRCKELYGSECVLISKVKLKRAILSFPDKLRALCTAFKAGKIPGFKDYDPLKDGSIPIKRLEDCTSENLSSLLDDLELNEALSRWTKNNHPLDIFAPNLLSSNDKFHRINPWNIFSHFIIQNSHFLWMGGNKALGNSIFRPDTRINILGGYRDLNWSPNYSFSAIDYELIWSHDRKASILDFVSGNVKEPKAFNYILFRQKESIANFIEHVSLILNDQKLPNKVHPQYVELSDKLRAKINTLFKRNQSKPALGLSKLISLSREEWRSNHLDIVLSFSRMSLNQNAFSELDYVQHSKLLNYKIYYGVNSALLFKEIKLANWLILVTISFSFLILGLIIAISFRILPYPIQSLITQIKSVQMDVLLSNRLGFQRPRSGDEIKTLENSFQFMKSELSLQFRQLHFIRMINYQILNKKALEETLQLLVDYMVNCLPNRPAGLAIYYYQSARQSEPTNSIQYGNPVDTSIIQFSDSQFEGTISNNEQNYNWYKRSFSEPKLSTSSYILMTIDTNALGTEWDASIKGFISTVLEQLQTLLYQTVLQQIQKDNEIASQLQQGILAPIKIINNYSQICADMRSAGYLGGDFFTVLERNNDILFGIADVTSKGIAPALVGNCARSLIHYFSDEDSAEILNKVNKSLIGEGLSEQHFVTCFMGTLDNQLNFNYVAAGHQMMIHINNKGEINYLNGPNIPLGLDSDQVFEIQSIQLKTGELVFLYTDGIPELQNHAYEIFSQERLERLIISLKNKSAQEIEHVVYSKISQFVGNRGISDDVTTVIIKV